MIVEVDTFYIRVQNQKPETSDGLDWIGFRCWKSSDKVTIYPNYGAIWFEIDRSSDETLSRLMDQAFKMKNEQAALCAYDRLVELGYLQLP